MGLCCQFISELSHLDPVTARVGKFFNNNFGPIIESTNAKVFSEEETIVTESVTIVLSKAGWIRSAKGHDIDPTTLSYRGDDSLQDFARGRSNQLAVFIDSNGKAYSMPSHSLPSARGMGEPITGRLNADSGVQFISSVIGNEGDKFLIMNTAGFGYISEYQNMISNKKTGRAFMKLPDHAKMLKAIPVKENHTYIASVSNIMMHGVGKITLFFCAGAIFVASGKKYVSELRGLGRKMPITMGAFMIGSLSVIGLPPLGGFISKWYLALGALDRDMTWVVVVLLVSSLLNVFYLLPVAVTAFFRDSEDDENTGMKEAPMACVVPLAITAIGCFVLFFFAEPILQLVGLSE